MKKLLPIILLLVGSGAGVGAGIFLRPPAEAAQVDAGKDAASDKGGDSASDKPDKAKGQADKGTTGKEPGGKEYVKLSNQFVVPIVKDRVVVSLVVMALTIEVTSDIKETVLKKEPKVRDSFLQVLFDHANIGGFDGSFTDAAMLKKLRMALREVAQRDLGRENVSDVLILEIARQDY